jgi:DNA invertase Pin-like site-specific DNA recombinase
VKPNRIYVDHGLTGTIRARPGLREALAACHTGDTLVVTKLDRIARSLTDARNIVEELTEAGVKLNIGGSVHDPTDPVGRLLFNVLAMIAEFESDLIRMHQGRDEGRQGQGPAARQTAQAQASPRGSPRRAVAWRPAHQHRARRPIRRCPLHRLPHRAARRRPTTTRPTADGWSASLNSSIASTKSSFEP